MVEHDPLENALDAHSAAAGSLDDRRGALVLVRCWLEPQSGGEPVVRGYIRDVRNGGQVAISGLESVEAHLRRQLHDPSPLREGREQAV